MSPAAASHYLSKVVVRGNERAFELQRLLSCPIQDVVNSLYPRMYSLLPMFLGESHLDLVDEDATDNPSLDFSDCDSPMGKPATMQSPFQGDATEDTVTGISITSPFVPQTSNLYALSSPSPFPTVPLSSYHVPCEHDRIVPGVGMMRALKKRELLRLLSTHSPSSELFSSDQVYLLDDRYRRIRLSNFFMSKQV